MLATFQIEINTLIYQECFSYHVMQYKHQFLPWWNMNNFLVGYNPLMPYNLHTLDRDPGPWGNMYLQYISSCALIETKNSIRLCMLGKGVNLFGSLSKITKQRLLVHARSPCRQCYLWYVPQAGLYAFIHSSLGIWNSSLQVEEQFIGKKGMTYCGKCLAPQELTHSVVAPSWGHCHLGVL